MTRLILLILLVMPHSAFSVVFGGSNLSFTGYPDHNCIKPIAPTKPYTLDEYSV